MTKEISKVLAGQFFVISMRPGQDIQKVSSYYDGVYIASEDYEDGDSIILGIPSEAGDHDTGATRTFSTETHRIGRVWTDMARLERVIRKIRRFAETPQRGEKLNWAGHVYTKAEGAAERLEEMLNRLRAGEGGVAFLPQSDTGPAPDVLMYKGVYYRRVEAEPEAPRRGHRMEMATGECAMPDPKLATPADDPVPSPMTATAEPLSPMMGSAMLGSTPYLTLRWEGGGNSIDLTVSGAPEEIIDILDSSQPLTDLLERVAGKSDD